MLILPFVQTAPLFGFEVAAMAMVSMVAIRLLGALAT